MRLNLVAQPRGPLPEPDVQQRVALQAVTAEQLALRIPGLTLPEARCVVATVHAGGDHRVPLPAVRRLSREAVCAVGYLPQLDVLDRVESAYDGFMKLTLGTPDGRAIECVRIPLEDPARFSICVSSQAGCALACAFCATGRLGLARNLQVWEIVEQVRLMRSTLLPGQRLHGVVFQGMGEPLANFERVREAIEVLRHPCALAIDARNITVSTAGLPSGIRRLGAELPNVRLAWSIGSVRAPIRSELMPINNAHGIEEVYQACVEHAQRTRLSPLWALTLLEGFNDTDADALELVALAQRFRAEAGRPPRISIIPYNPIGDSDAEPFRRVSDEKERHFRELMHAQGVYTHRRYSGGGDVAAACGQLAAKSARRATEAL